MTWLAAAKVALVLASGWFALSMMRRTSASMRHLVVVTVLTSALIIPALEFVLPSWQVLPRSDTATSAATFKRLTAPAQPPVAAYGRAPTPVPVADRIDLDRWLAYAWAAGCMSLLVLLLARTVAMHVAVRRARTLADPAWNRLLEETRDALGMRKPVELRIRGARTMPAAWGHKHPIVLLPGDCFGWSDERRRAVLSHELAHIVRSDILAVLIGHLACALHWFNPLVWILKNRLATECEQACDDAAIAQGISPRRYAEHLLFTAAAYRKQRSFEPVMAARSQLEGRITAILDTNRNRRSALLGARLSVTVIAASTLVPLSSVTWANQDDQLHERSEEVAIQSDSAEFTRRLRVLRIDTDDTQALLSALRAQSPLTRGTSAWALGKSNDPVVIDPLIQASYDTDARVRQWAVRSLSRWDAPRVTEALIDRLRDADAEVRQWAVRGLSDIRDVRLTKSLIPMLQDDDSEVREWSVRALGDCGNERAAGALKALRDDPDEDVREWVERALEAIDCRQASVGRT